MNKLTIIGNVCHSPETRSTQSGNTVCSFDVAVNSRRANGQTQYFRVSAWNKTAELCGRYVVKGKKVAVTGEVTARAYLAKDGSPRASMELTADEVEFLSPREQNELADTRMAQIESEQRQAAEQYQQAAPKEWEEIKDDELPF